MKNYFRGFIAAFVLSAIAACMTTPISGKHAFNLVPESQEISMGESAYQDVLKKEPISNDARLNAIVTRVGQRIAAVADKPEYHWEFKVIDKNIQNAFCLPGGKIAVYKGILPITKNEAGLATVMSHEVVHALARHGGQRMTQQMGTTFLMTGLALTLLKPNADETPEQAQKKNLMIAALGAGATVGLILPFSRGNESEADESGQILMARAGYDPSESIKFWERFSEATKGPSQPAFLSTHPASASRAQDLRERLPTAQAEYAKASTKFGLGDTF